MPKLQNQSLEFEKNPARYGGLQFHGILFIIRRRDGHEAVFIV
jgi:hypothetical protein